MYRNKFKKRGILPSDINTLSDIRRLPFTTKKDLFARYPMNGILAVPREEIVRLHMTSGTTGKPVLSPFTANGWTTVVRNAVVLKTTGCLGARIDIPKNHYDKLRLRLSCYYRRARQALSPIESAVVTAERHGKVFVEQVLPGAGLWIQTLTVAIQAQFQGRWQVGHEIITNGRKDLHALVSGTMQHVGIKPMQLNIEVRQKWPNRSLVIRLFP